MKPRTRTRSASVRRAVIAAAAALGTAALVNLARTRAAESANPPEGRFVTGGGVRLHYVERGVGEPGAPVIVLVHGNGSMIQDFEISGLVDRLAERHRVIVFDRPGSGYSERPRGMVWTPQRQAAALVEACSALGILRPVVVGHSWGTLVGAAWALDHPRRIAGLVLMSGYYYPTPRIDVISQMPLATPVLGDVYQATVAPLVGRLALPLGNKLIFAPADPAPAFVERFPFEMALRPSQLRATFEDTAQMIAAAASLAPRYGEMTLPLSIVGGTGDMLVSFDAHSRRLSEELPHASLVAIAGAGHMVHHLAPDRVAAAIEKLAGSLRVASALRVPVFA